MLLLPVVMSRKREEAIAAGIHVNDIQHTMKRRTPSHNYCDKGIYMLTLVVDGRMPLFGALKDDGRLPLSGTLKGDGRMPLSGPLKGVELVPSAAADAPRVVLSPLGEAIRDREIAKISAVYPMVEVWKLCIMPDHLHIIVRVKEKLPEGKHLGHVVSGFMTGCTRAWWALVEEGKMPPFGKPKGTEGSASAPAGSASALALGGLRSPWLRSVRPWLRFRCWWLRFAFWGLRSPWLRFAFGGLRARWFSSGRCFRCPSSVPLRKGLQRQDPSSSWTA